MIGTTISHYKIVEKLGAGGMGEVWLAEDTDLPRQVAIKFLSANLAQDKNAMTRLQREAQATASVDHPAVVTVYEFGQAGDRPYIVMQRIEGETLSDRMARAPVPIDERVGIVT